MPATVNPVITNPPSESREGLESDVQLGRTGSKASLESARSETHTEDGTTETLARTTAPARHRRKSSQLSAADSDLELEEMGDPLYSNGASVGAQERLASQHSKKRSIMDQMIDRNMDQGGTNAEKEARREGTRQFVEKTLINLVLIALWYILSISMSVYNKWMFSPGNLDFHYPLFTTSVHMLVQFLMATTVLWIFPNFRPQRGGSESLDPERDTRIKDPVDPSKPIMTPWFYLTRIASCGTVTGLDIGLGNTSLKFISLTFFTMCKSSTLGFVLGFAILFRLEKPSWKIGGIIFIMTVGVIMMVAGETAFDTLGFVLLMLASFFSGLRWSLTQILLRRTPATSNPFSTLFFLTPVMFAVLFIIAIPAEGFGALKVGLDHLAEQKGLFMGILIVLFPGAIAFCMTSAEFALLKRTSVVTLSVSGIFKEVLTITAAGFIFGDELTPINISGLIITIIAIAIYNITRMRRMRRKEMDKAQDRWNEQNEPMMAPDDVGMASERTQSLDRTTGLMPSSPLPALFMKRKEYEEVGQEDREYR